jgi:DNA polymerase-1
MSRLLIIDGNAILHRAFHAIPPLTSPDGTVVNAVYGFVSMVLRLRDELVPTHFVVCFDRPKPTFRKELFEGYQKKRPKMDDSLAQQIPIVHSILEAMKIPIFEADGFEADDVIGTIVHTMKQLQEKDTPEIIIVTGDRDIMQLIDDHVSTFMPTKGLSEAKLYGPEEAKARIGVTPAMIPDFKALAGDSSDNYPGVPGIGPKTAIDLLNAFGSVEALFDALEHHDAAADKLPTGVREKLNAGKESATLGKTLATIRRDAPIDIVFEKTHITDPATPEAIHEVENLGFQSLLKRLTKQTTELKKQVTTKKNEPQPDDPQMSLI